MDTAFENRRALIAGGSSGIGRAIARHLARRGAEILAVARREGPLAETKQEIETAVPGAVVRPISVDLTEEEEIPRLAREALRSGGIDILVLSFGRFDRGTVEGAPASQLEDLLRVNCGAQWRLVRAFLPSLRERCGQIVFVNSSVGVASRGGISAYSASKHALKALADGLREEVNPAGVRVLSIYPGRTATPMQQEILEEEGRAWDPERLLQPGDVATMVGAALALPRTAEVTDLHVRPLQKV